MKKFSLFALMAMMFTIVSCSDDAETTTNKYTGLWVEAKGNSVMLMDKHGTFSDTYHWGTWSYDNATTTISARTESNSFLWQLKKNDFEGWYAQIDGVEEHYLRATISTLTETTFFNPSRWVDDNGRTPYDYAVEAARGIEGAMGYKIVYLAQGDSDTEGLYRVLVDTYKKEGGQGNFNMQLAEEHPFTLQHTDDIRKLTLVLNGTKEFHFRPSRTAER